MNHKSLILALFAGALVLSAPRVWAADQQPTKQKVQTQTRDREQIYGSELMSQQERNEYRERMRNAKSEQEREKIRGEHHERMVARAKEQGVKIPEQPPAKGGGIGPGGGMGPGAGGMGPGGAGKGGGPRR